MPAAQARVRRDQWQLRIAAGRRGQRARAHTTRQLRMAAGRRANVQKGLSAAQLGDEGGECVGSIGAEGEVGDPGLLTSPAQLVGGC
jgi:hypothetical protein